MRYLAILASLFFCSCAPTLSELWVNSDESGKMEMTYDLGEMAGMLEGMFKETQEGANSDDSESTMGKGREVMDSTMNFYDIMPDSVRQKMDRPELMKNIEMSMKMDESKEEMAMKMSFQYKSEEELRDILKEMAKLQENGAEVNPMLGMMGGDEVNGMLIQYDTDKKNNVIRMPRVNMLEEMANDPEMPDDFMSDIDSLVQVIQTEGLNDKNQEQVDMLRMFMGGETKTVVHAPGKILFTNDRNAVIEGNKVTFTTDILSDMMAGKEPEFYEWVIKYK